MGNQNWVKRNPERQAKIKLDYLLRWPERRIWKAAKYNARSRNLDFNFNIQIISRRANVMKHDASLEELQMFANWINNAGT